MSELLKEIEKGTDLKQVETVDKSAPATEVCTLVVIEYDFSSLALAGCFCRKG